MTDEKKEVRQPENTSQLTDKDRESYRLWFKNICDWTDVYREAMYEIDKETNREILIYALIVAGITLLASVITHFGIF